MKDGTYRTVARVRAIAVAVCATACHGDQPAGPSVTIPPAQLSVSLAVTNTRLGTALPADFTLAARSAVGLSSAWHGSKDISVPGNGSYDVIVTDAPDGNTFTRSASCSGSGRPRATPPPCVITAAESPLTCDDGLWALTYSRDRLTVLANCEVVTGVVDRSSLEHDGDLVLRIIPDSPYRNLLREGNAAIQNRLVIEIPCQGAIDQADALGACDHQQVRPVSAPPGAHIAAAAHHVQDRNHGMWAELHGAIVRVLPR